MVDKAQYERPTCTGCAIQWSYEVMEEHGDVVFVSTDKFRVDIECPNCGQDNEVFYFYDATLKPQNEE